jgi:hypothetical protein
LYSLKLLEKLMSILDKILLTEAVIGVFGYFMVLITDKETDKRLIQAFGLTTIIAGLAIVVTFIVKIWIEL